MKAKRVQLINFTISTRVTKPLYDLMVQYLHRGGHITTADFIRDSIREKLQREVPELYNDMLGTPPP